MTALALGLAVSVASSANANNVPVLAGPWSTDQEGYGQARPSRIYNGGDPTGLITHIHWHTWGHSRAIGAGTAEWVAPQQSVAEGHSEKARIVLFGLGHCKGRRAYNAIEWYFPQHGQRFNPHQYINACTGTYYPRH